MSHVLIQNIPWSVLQPDAKTMINHYLSKYIGNVSFDFAYDSAFPIGCLALVCGTVTTAVVRMMRNNNKILKKSL